MGQEDGNTPYENQLNEFCSLYGFSLLKMHEKSFHNGRLVTTFTIKFGNSAVRFRRADKKFRRTWDNEPCQFRTKTAEGKYMKLEKTAELALLALSGQELTIRRRSVSKAKEWYGWKNVDEEMHFIVPEFSSVEELRLKLELIGRT